MSTQTPQMPVFNELRLRQEINDKWGAHGAHAEVYSMLLTDRDRLKALCEELREALVIIIATYEAAGSYQQVQDSAFNMMKIAEEALKKAQKDI